MIKKIIFLFLALSFPFFANTGQANFGQIVTAADKGEYQRAYKLLEELASAGDAEAMGFLGFVIFSEEWGVVEDKVRAGELLKFAAKADDPFANLMIGLFNIFDPEETELLNIAVKDPKGYVKIAADLGHPFAQSYMAKLELEQMVKIQVDRIKNPKAYSPAKANAKLKHRGKAISWLNKAAASGQIIAETERFQFVERFKRPITDRFQEMMALSKSGSAGILFEIGVSYFSGLGTEPDQEEGIKYMILARYFGSLVANKTDITFFNKTITKDQIALGEKRAAEWLHTVTRDKDTYLGKASAWCIEQNDESKACIGMSIKHHGTCEMPYMGKEFKNFTSFPAYKDCRSDFYN